MSAPGVGPTTAVAFAAVVDDPSRFTSIKDIGPYLGLTPKKYQSGDVDRQGSISKTGCRMTRHLLFEAAGILITRLKKDCALRQWSMALASRFGLRKATVAAARKLATILLALWRQDKDFVANCRGFYQDIIPVAGDVNCDQIERRWCMCNVSHLGFLLR